jgi:hypothetical protein
MRIIRKKNYLNYGIVPGIVFWTAFPILNRRTSRRSFTYAERSIPLFERLTGSSRIMPIIPDKSFTFVSQ